LCGIARLGANTLNLVSNWEKGLWQGDSEASYRRCNRGNKLMCRYDQRKHGAYLETRSASRDDRTWSSG
jgi:hypothetical protein